MTQSVETKPEVEWTLQALLDQVNNEGSNPELRQRILMESKGVVVVNGGIVPRAAKLLKEKGYHVQTVKDSIAGNICVYVQIKNETILLYCDDSLSNIWASRWLEFRLQRAGSFLLWLDRFIVKHFGRYINKTK